MKVITVTLNPVLERTMIVHYLALGYHNQTIETTSLAPAGRGVNISRALYNVQAETVAVVLLGSDPSGVAYQSLIAREKFPLKIVSVPGQTRSQIVLLDTGHKTETTIREDNEGFDIAEVDRVMALVKAMLEPGDFVVYAGPLPKGIPAAKYADLVNEAQAAGARVVLDLPNTGLHEAIQAKPALIYMTQPQMEGYFNYPVRTNDDIAYCVQKLREEGAESVLVLLNNDRGAVLAGEDELLIAEFPELHTGTRSGTVGALLAGYLAERMKNVPQDRALRMGAAAALYAVEHVGMEFPGAWDLRDLLRRCEIRPLPANNPVSEG